MMHLSLTLDDPSRTLDNPSYISHYLCRNLSSHHSHRRQDLYENNGAGPKKSPGGRGKGGRGSRGGRGYAHLYPAATVHPSPTHSHSLDACSHASFAPSQTHLLTHPRSNVLTNTHSLSTTSTLHPFPSPGASRLVRQRGAAPRRTTRRPAARARAREGGKSRGRAAEVIIIIIDRLTDLTDWRHRRHWPPPSSFRMNLSYIIELSHYPYSTLLYPNLY